MESGILGDYVDFIRKTHPDAPVAPVYLSAAIIRQAIDERATYGDEPFFRRLNAGRTGAGSAWGDLEAAWDAEHLMRRRSAAVVRSTFAAVEHALENCGQLARGSHQQSGRQLRSFRSRGCPSSASTRRPGLRLR